MTYQKGKGNSKTKSVSWKQKIAMNTDLQDVLALKTYSLLSIFIISFINLIRINPHIDEILLILL